MKKIWLNLKSTVFFIKQLCNLVQGYNNRDTFTVWIIANSFDIY